MTTRYNALDQQLDIKGSTTQDDTRTLTDETGFLGTPVAGQTGAVASIDAFGAGVATIGGLTGMTADSVGRFLTLSGADTAGNNGTFLIITFNSATSVDVSNPAGGSPDANDGAISWVEREAYSLLDDLDFERTDRSAIKGVSYDAAIPTYQRPTAVGTDVPANLSNIASKTTDAKALVVNRKFEDQAVAESDTLVTLSDPGNLKHADGVDRTGVPVFDGTDAGDHVATFVEIIESTTGTALTVIGKAVGSIDCDAGGTGVLPADTETFTLDDGTNPAVIFEFDTNATFTDVQVDISAAGDEDDVRDAIIAAVNNQRTLGNLNIFAEIGGAGLVQLTNDNPGTAGNVAITETVADGDFVVAGMAGGTAEFGNRIFGRTNTGGSTSPNSVEVEFRSVPIGDDVSTSVAYTWERDQPTTIDIYYGFRERLDTMPETALRTVLTNGIVGDANLAQDIEDIRTSVGIVDGDTDLFGLLTNTTPFYVFSTLDTTPTVVEALNALNDEIGTRDYTGVYLTDGETITESLQALSDAIAGSSVTRYIERLASAVAKNTAHTLPGAATYTIDGTGNGRNLWVFWRGVLRDPGTVANGDDYEETSTTQITPYSNINSNDHINYFVLM